MIRVLAILFATLWAAPAEPRRRFPPVSTRRHTLILDTTQGRIVDRAAQRHCAASCAERMEQLCARRLL